MGVDALDVGAPVGRGIGEQCEHGLLRFALVHPLAGSWLSITLWSPDLVGH